MLKSEHFPHLERIPTPKASYKYNSVDNDYSLEYGRTFDDVVGYDIECFKGEGIKYLVFHFEDDISGTWADDNYIGWFIFCLRKNKIKKIINRILENQK